MKKFYIMLVIVLGSVLGSTVGWIIGSGLADLHNKHKEPVKQVEQPKKDVAKPAPQTIYITKGKAELVKSLYIENLLCATAGYGSPQKMKTFKDKVLGLVMVKEDMTEYTYTAAYFDAFENNVSDFISKQPQEKEEQMFAELPSRCSMAPIRLKNILDGLPVLTKDEIKKVYDLEKQDKVTK